MIKRLIKSILWIIGAGALIFIWNWVGYWALLPISDFSGNDAIETTFILAGFVVTFGAICLIYGISQYIYWLFKGKLFKWPLK